MLIEHWSDYDNALHEVLYSARREILVFDRDLSRFDLRSSATIEHLFELSRAQRENRIRILLREGRDPLPALPRLASLLRSFPEQIELAACAESCQALPDCLLIVDGERALSRPHQDWPRGRLREAAEEVFPLRQRWLEIREEGCQPFGATTLGL